jgi:hypothetical protein
MAEGTSSAAGRDESLLYAPCATRGGETNMRVTTVEEAERVLHQWQLANNNGISTIPARNATEETEMGWAFFNVNGYLGTVTTDGDVVEETGRDVD